jgi:murein L,D-transpeptidase YcbB/YkuD
MERTKPKQHAVRYADRTARRVAILVSVSCLNALLLAGCSRESLEERARKQAEKVIEGMGEKENRALAQQVTPEQVRQAQEALTRAHEYMGEVNGTLDAVTINAIEAFQRAHGLTDTGILNKKTQRLLQEELAAK